MIARTLALSLLCLAPLSGALALACARSVPAEAQRSEYLAEARAAHAAADAATTREERELAAKKTGAAFETPAGAPDAAPSALETLTRQDLADRSARLAFELGRYDEALGWVERGLALSSAPSIVRANLLVTRADVLDALGRSAEAKTSLMAALAINQTLLTQELSSP